MKIAYLDCLSGISGDMFLAACIDAGADFQTIQEGLDSLHTDNLKLEKSDVKKYGFRALKVDVIHEPEHAHRHLHHIVEMIDKSQITPRQKELAKSIFEKVAIAEAKVHGSTIEKVHFHEVGAIDSIADIVGGAIAWDLLGADRLVCSPIPTGNGKIKIAHGWVSIPAPATAEILKEIPTASCDIDAELTTPTGAAIVAALADQFGPLPSMEIENIGIGAGTRDLDEQANVLRLVMGNQTADPRTETITLLETNLDHLSAEALGYCQEKLSDHGALDVYTTSIMMKKNRPAVMLSVLCQPADADLLESILFQETGTLGIRRSTVHRSILPRETVEQETALGKVQFKKATLPDGSIRMHPEFECVAKIAKESGRSWQSIFDELKKEA